MSDATEKEPTIQEEPGFDWTQWAEPMTEDELAQIPSEEEYAKMKKVKLPQRE